MNVSNALNAQENDILFGCSRAMIVQGRISKNKKKMSLMDQPYIKDNSKTVQTVVKETIAQLGENISVRRFDRYLDLFCVDLVSMSKPFESCRGSLHTECHFVDKLLKKFIVYCCYGSELRPHACIHVIADHIFNYQLYVINRRRCYIHEILGDGVLPHGMESSYWARLPGLSWVRG